MVELSDGWMNGNMFQAIHLLRRNNKKIRDSFSAFRINRTAFAAIQISSTQTVDSETLVSNPSPLSLSNLVKASSHDEVSNLRKIVVNLF